MSAGTQQVIILPPCSAKHVLLSALQITEATIPKGSSWELERGPPVLKTILANAPACSWFPAKYISLKGVSLWKSHPPLFSCHNVSHRLLEELPDDNKLYHSTVASSLTIYCKCFKAALVISIAQNKHSNHNKIHVFSFVQVSNPTAE